MAMLLRSKSLIDGGCRPRCYRPAAMKDIMMLLLLLLTATTTITTIVSGEMIVAEVEEGGAASNMMETSSPNDVVKSSYNLRALASGMEEEEEEVASTFLAKAAAVDSPQVLVAAYYYPWYNVDNNFHGAKFLRKELDPPQLPQLGLYDNRNDVSVINQHVEWSYQANIKVWITSWFGPDSTTDATIQTSIITNSQFQQRDMKFVIMYETASRLGPTFDDLSVVKSDIKYLAEHYFDHPHYLNMNGYPVLVVYLSRVLYERGTLNDVLLKMKRAAKEVGYDDLYIIGDHIFGNVPSDGDQEEFVFDMRRLDALTTHDVYGSLAAQGTHAMKEEVEAYMEQQSLWKEFANESGKAFIPAVTPGFNNNVVTAGDDLPILSRRLDNEDKSDGSLFDKMLKESTKLVDSQASYMLIVNSFNKWEEDTQIEPTIDTDTTTTNDQSLSGEEYTKGLKYRTYGTKMLDMVSERTRGYIIEDPPIPPIIKSKAMVAVYYYPWHGNNNFHGRKYLREKLVPPQLPVLGEYNDRDPKVIEQHVQWSLDANIQVWVSSWWGPGSGTDVTTRDVILPNTKFIKSNIKIALFYETEGRMGRDFNSFDNIERDVEYMTKHYFNHPNYLYIDDKPVVVIYLTRVLGDKGHLERVTNLMRTAAKNAGGFDLYLIGDHVFRSPPKESKSSYQPLVEEIQLLDAVTNYDVYGSANAAGSYATQEEVNSYYNAQDKWRKLANSLRKGFVPVASPGYNDRAVRLDANHDGLSRQLESSNNAHGTLFKAMLQQAVTLVDNSVDKLMLVTSFNEWHEDTQIEPVQITKEPTTIDNSNSGDLYCQNLEYEGYGTLYLDILRDETTYVNDE